MIDTVFFGIKVRMSGLCINQYCLTIALSVHP